MKEVAQAAGVSQATVSNAYNRLDRLSPAQREHVLATARSLGYPGPSAAGRSLRTGRVGAVGVMVTDALTFALEDSAAVELLRGIAAISEARNVALTLLPFPVAGGPDGVAHATVSTRRGVVDGFLVFSMPDDHPAVQAARSRHEPMVVIDAPRLAEVPTIGIHDLRAAREAATEVLALGHRRVAILVDRLSPDRHAGPVTEARLATARDQVARERVEGFLRACKEAGLTPEDTVVIEAGGFSRPYFRAATVAALEIDGLSAILATTDAIALQALAELRERGTPAPERVSVLGFDDIAEAERTGLSTVRQPIVEKGGRAMRMLLALIDGESPGRTVLPTRLLLRDSTGPPPPY